MKKYKIFVNDEILAEGLTLLQATNLVNKLKKMFSTCTIEIGK